MDPLNFDFNALLKKHQKTYKNKPTNLSSVAGGTLKRFEANLKKRRSSRLTTFDQARDLPKSETPVKKSAVQTKLEQRRLQLEKWKEEKERKKKEIAKRKPKPFVAGIAHAPLKYEPPPPLKGFNKPVPSTSGMVTRSQAARNKKDKGETLSFAPKSAVFRAPVLKNKNLPVLTLPTKPTERKKKNDTAITFNPVLPSGKGIPKSRRSQDNDAGKGSITLLRERSSSRFTQYSTQSSSQSSDSAESVQNENLMGSQSSSSSDTENMFNSNRRSISKKDTMLLSGESSSEDRDVRTPVKTIGDTTRISPCVTFSRGKDNARREMKKKIDEGLLDEDLSNMDSVDDFRRQLASEIERITELCDTWDKVLEQNQLPDTVQEYVLAAVGQARLLMSQKLQQFASLVERCSSPEPGTALVTPADLQGFWDMVFMQVENVYLRFKKLDELRDRGWVEDRPVEAKKRPVTKANPKKAKPNGAPSRLKEMIAAARKAKKAQESEGSSERETLSSSSSVTGSDSESKTFEAGFFSVRSPVKSPAVCTPSKPNLLKAVLSNEAKKASASKCSASFAILRASVMSKSVEWDGVAPLPQTPLTPINLLATPGRSILKSNIKDSERKSIKVVLFDNSEDSDNSTNCEQGKVSGDNSNPDTDEDVPEIKEDVPEVKEDVPKVKEDMETIKSIKDKSTDDVEIPMRRISDTGTGGKENRKGKKLQRQAAIEISTPSPIQTRRQRSMRTPLQDIPNERLPQSEKCVHAEETPRRITRSRKSMPK